MYHSWLFFSLYSHYVIVVVFRLINILIFISKLIYTFLVHQQKITIVRRALVLNRVFDQTNYLTGHQG